MSKTRWEQIHCFLTFNPDLNAGEQPRTFFDKLEPVCSHIRTACQEAAVPASWLAVDEAMVAFKGRSKHTVKIQGKPISEGYKIWVLACRGAYIVDWLFHSRVDGTQDCPKSSKQLFYRPVPFRPILLAPTFQVPVRLFQKLVSRLPGQKWLAFLDNLFLTVDLAHILMVMRIRVMGTTRKSNDTIPERLRLVKETNTGLVYGGHVLEVTDDVLCFAWQDNNTILGITTSYGLDNDAEEDWVIRERWRPKPTSTNYHIAKSVFKNETRKALPIPTCIDHYNHGMNAVDVSNQHRSNLSFHLQFERRIWRPLGEWLFDVALHNAYSLWRLHTSSKIQASHRMHEAFEKALIHALLHPNSTHTPISQLGKGRRCRWGALAPGQCTQGQDISYIRGNGVGKRPRKVLEEVDVNAPRPTPKTRSRCVKSGCEECQVALCIDRPCFDSYHLYIHTKKL